MRISKSIVMRGFHTYFTLFSEEGAYTATPFDGTEFRYVDLNHPFFSKIRKDKRISHLYKNNRQIDFYKAVFMANFLRDLFPHGPPHKSYYRDSVLEMMDAAENGEKFLCADISKMLAQLIQASGNQARIVSLSNSKGKAHVVLEMWSNHFNKWAIIDADYNVYYQDDKNIPLSALELYQIANSKNQMNKVKRVAGNSLNTLHTSNTKLIETLYKEGFTIWFYNKWIESDFSRWHPARSPHNMGFYLGNSALLRFCYRLSNSSETQDLRNIVYAPP
ncbi:MAG: hypothetical protein SCALA701_02400 [Candidatus Scalindua sp.]|nr:hypothetical protein [Planctomycetota bacterium]RZV93995.1 MAG: hypothetical protein EX341_03830 [Candidatus Scalindua sp. SCAELEC01]GJQ57439.1 MAG: hypothetical protein SCALA701_02400 [Candidatus Scalindua sp.]